MFNPVYPDRLSFLQKGLNSHDNFKKCVLLSKQNVYRVIYEEVVLLLWLPLPARRSITQTIGTRKTDTFLPHDKNIIYQLPKSWSVHNLKSYKKIKKLTGKKREKKMCKGWWVCHIVCKKHTRLTWATCNFCLHVLFLHTNTITQVTHAFSLWAARMSCQLLLLRRCCWASRGPQSVRRPPRSALALP